MRALSLAALALLLTTPAPQALSSPEPAATVYERIVAGIVEALGSVPPTAVFNGVEVPSGEVLAWFRANDAPLPPGEGLHLPPDDVGVGVRPASASSCTVGAILTAYAISYPPGAEALVEEEVQPPLEPAGTLRCGGLAIPWFRGVAGARVAETASYSIACVNAWAGYWVSGQDPCYTGVAAANAASDVGFVDARLCFFLCFRIEQMFAGIEAGPAPLPAEVGRLNYDVGLIAIQDA